uniref:Uncharacterized protein n=1 Tax=Arundo donax TaxID=35708 RepID=A0A0A9CVX6_ARUDO
MLIILLHQPSCFFFKNPESSVLYVTTLGMHELHRILCRNEIASLKREASINPLIIWVHNTVSSLKSSLSIMSSASAHRPSLHSACAKQPTVNLSMQNPDSNISFCTRNPISTCPAVASTCTRAL